MQYNKEVCELKHQQNDKDHEAMKELIKTIHEGDERFIAREVTQIYEELKKVEDLEKRVKSLERWRTYLLGLSAAAGFLLFMLLKVLTLL